MAQINIDSTEAPQAPNEIMNGSSTQSREKGSLQLKTCLELHKVALKGDRETAKYLLEQGPQSILSASITTGHQTVLHIATAAKKTNFVKELVNRMEQEELALKDKNGNTAFCFAAAAGVVEIAKIILTKNSSLMTIRGAENLVEIAKIILTKNSNLALNLLKDHPELAVARDMNCDTALHVLARMSSTFARKDRGLLEGLISSFPGMKFVTHNKDSKSNQALQLVSCLWEEILKRDDLELTSLLGKPSQLSFDAAKLGNFEFLAELIGCYPDLAYELDNNNHTIFHHLLTSLLLLISCRQLDLGDVFRGTEHLVDKDRPHNSVGASFYFESTT
ncbi:hypothetical protein Pint_12341 [Pistacia integerrima]|uniref:Uncharacterized protein n=1 Tax=Pistacia integerrima TaxID=434235 RepID=A0ACC0XJ70_9ROSI|nr:hypothetical protein Pint_12341 [Pistacia integerrima]